MVYHAVVADHPLSEGENWSSEDLSEQYVHVSSNKPVSALALLGFRLNFSDF